jgi:hypothetical protein
MDTRCRKYGEPECILDSSPGCMDSVGDPCIFDNVKCPQMVCDMGTCPSNFDRENTQCPGCRHLVPAASLKRGDGCTLSLSE